jgi:CheY-like chemotaxis protein
MKTILLADDEHNLRLLVRTILDDPEYCILEALTGPLLSIWRARSALICCSWTG